MFNTVALIFRVLSIFFFAFGFYVNVSANETSVNVIDVSHSVAGQDIFQNALFFEDENSTVYHPTDFHNGINWHLLTQQSSKSGISANPHWVKFTLLNTSDVAKKVILASDIAFLDKLEIYTKSNADFTYDIVDGTVPFGRRKILSPIPAIEVEVAPVSSIEVYVKLTNLHVEFTSLYLNLWDRELFYQYNTAYIAKIVFFSAIALTFGGVWLIFSVVLKQQRFFVYSLVISLAGVYYLSYSGVSFQFIYPESPEVHNRLFVFAIQLSLTFSFLFFILHLSPAENGFPLINKILWFLFFTGSIFSLNALFRVSDTLAVVGAMSFSGLTILNSIFGIRVWLRTRESFAFWFMIGWSLFGISMFAFMLFFSMGIGTKFLSNNIAHETAQFLILIEGTTLSISLARWFLTQQSEKKQAEVAALTDPLTGLFNRRALDVELERRQISSVTKKKYAVVIIDIDHFKEINDSYGHASGDQVLNKVSSLIKSSIRDSDTAFRIGGEEFLILLDKCDEAEAFTITDRLRKAFEDSPTLADGETIAHTLSAGIAVNTDAFFEQVLKNADDALYKAKKEGRNKVTPYYRYEQDATFINC